MASVRVEKFERQMQRDLGEIFQQRGKDWFEGAFITVSEVQSSPDLGYVKCFVTMFNTKDTNKTMELIELKSKEIRMEIARKNKHLRKTPELTFIEDKSLEYVAKMDALFAKINNEKKNED